MDTLPIGRGRKSGAHLYPHSVNFPARLTSFSRNDTLGANLFADVLMVAFTVELGIGQNRSNGAAWNS